jgi:hypothetical protein
METIDADMWLSPAIHRLCALDPVWARYVQVVDIEQIADSRLEFFTMKGLPFIQALISASTRRDLTTLLGPDPRLSRTDMRLSSLIRDTISLGPYNGTLDITYHGQYDGIVAFEWDDDAQQVVQKPLFQDIDRGPTATWIWAHPDADARPHSRPCESQHTRLRREGYLLWDWSRCKDVWLQEPFDGLPGGSALVQHDSPLQGWFWDEVVKDRDRLAMSRYRLGLRGVPRFEEVMTMVEQNVLEHARYDMAIELNPAS